MKWTKALPCKEGLYLRNNPATVNVCRHEVLALHGGLVISDQDGGLIKVETLKRKAFWWFGPIPKPPQYIEEIQSRLDAKDARRK